jgi:hypothetical protein
MKLERSSVMRWAEDRPEQGPEDRESARVIRIQERIALGIPRPRARTPGTPCQVIRWDFRNERTTALAIEHPGRDEEEIMDVPAYVRRCG